MVFLAINDSVTRCRALKNKAYIVSFAAILAIQASLAWSQTRELGGTGELLDGVAAIVDDGVVLVEGPPDALRAIPVTRALVTHRAPAMMSVVRFILRAYRDGRHARITVARVGQR